MEELLKWLEIINVEPEGEARGTFWKTLPAPPL
jgi:hypothetical protein